MPKHTTIITVETRSLMVFRSRSSRRAWCPACSAETDVILLERAELPTQHVSVFERWLNSEGVHWTDAPEGSLFICLRSLMDCVHDTNPRDCALPQLPEHKKERA